jgi:hypothetical protein
MVFKNFEFYSSNIFNYGGAQVIYQNERQLCIGIWDCEKVILSYGNHMVNILLNLNVSNYYSIFDINDYQDSFILIATSIVLHSANIGFLGIMSYAYFKKKIWKCSTRIFWWLFVLSFFLMKMLLVISYLKAILGSIVLISKSYRGAPSSLITSIYLSDSVMIAIFSIEWLWVFYEFINVSRYLNKCTYLNTKNEIIND